MFRHFASKQYLVAATVCDQLDGLSAAGAELLATTDPTAALFEFMGRGVELQAQDRSISQAAIGVEQDDPQIRAAAERLCRTEALTGRAHRQGGIRLEVTGADVVLLLRAAYQAAALVAPTVPGLWRRYLTVVDGLRSSSTGRLPGPAPVLSASALMLGSGRTDAGGADPALPSSALQGIRHSHDRDRG